MTTGVGWWRAITDAVERSVMAFSVVRPLGFCMANGKSALLNVQGKVDSEGRLVLVQQAVSGTPRVGTLGNLVCAVDASNRLVVTFG